jgi:hypothetical protein
LIEEYYRFFDICVINIYIRFAICGVSCLHVKNTSIPMSRRNEKNVKIFNNAQITILIIPTRKFPKYEKHFLSSIKRRCVIQ